MSNTGRVRKPIYQFDVNCKLTGVEFTCAADAETKLKRPAGTINHYLRKSLLLDGFYYAYETQFHVPLKSY